MGSRVEELSEQLDNLELSASDSFGKKIAPKTNSTKASEQKICKDNPDKAVLAAFLEKSTRSSAPKERISGEKSADNSKKPVNTQNKNIRNDQKKQINAKNVVHLGPTGACRPTMAAEMYYSQLNIGDEVIGKKRSCDADVNPKAFMRTDPFLDQYQQQQWSQSPGLVPSPGSQASPAQIVPDVTLRGSPDFQQRSPDYQQRSPDYCQNTGLLDEVTVNGEDVLGDLLSVVEQDLQKNHAQYVSPVPTPKDIYVGANIPPTSQVTSASNLTDMVSTSVVPATRVDEFNIPTESHRQQAVLATETHRTHTAREQSSTDAILDKLRHIKQGLSPSENRIATIKLFINQFSDQYFHAKDKKGNTFLMQYVLKEQFDHCKLTLERLAREGLTAKFINLANKNGKTPLYAAVEMGQADIVHLLLQHGANPNLTCTLCDESGNVSEGVLPLHCAVARPERFNALRALLSADISLSVIDSDGNTGIEHALVGHRPFGSPARNNMMSVRLLIEKKSPAVRNNIHMKTTLMFAAETGDLNMVHFILQQPGAESMLNKRDLAWNTVLHQIVTSSVPVPQQVQLLRLLIDRGANPRHLNRDERAAWQLTKHPEVSMAAGQMLMTAAVNVYPGIQPLNRMVQPMAVRSNHPMPQSTMQPNMPYNPASNSQTSMYNNSAVAATSGPQMNFAPVNGQTEFTQNVPYRDIHKVSVPTNARSSNAPAHQQSVLLESMPPTQMPVARPSVTCGLPPQQTSPIPANTLPSAACSLPPQQTSPNPANTLPAGFDSTCQLPPQHMSPVANSTLPTNFDPTYSQPTRYQAATSIQNNAVYSNMPVSYPSNSQLSHSPHQRGSPLMETYAKAYDAANSPHMSTGSPILATNSKKLQANSPPFPENSPKLPANSAQMPQLSYAESQMTQSPHYSNQGSPSMNYVPNSSYGIIQQSPVAADAAYGSLMSSNPADDFIDAVTAPREFNALS